MANVTSSLAPGIYDGAKSTTLSFSAAVVEVAVTVNAAPPSISKYIAYDTLSPANPFIAVTEDGRGRVVYDGGFPKFYNTYVPAVTNTFADLSPAMRYLHNAIKWVINPTKLAAGNNKVLFIGDTVTDNIYNVKSTDTSGFALTIAAVARVVGVIPTILNLEDYDSYKLNPTLAYLEQFACVVFFGSNSGAQEPLITPAAISAFVKYRENNNGLVFITDHGEFLTSIEDTKLPGGSNFFKTVNGIIYNFGAYFTGNYDRSPVNVGFLRANYGDHPLYNGMSNSEDIFAGGSESRVAVTTLVTVPPGSVQPIVLNKQGYNTVSVLMRLSDGSIDTQSYQYSIQIDDFVWFDTYNPETGSWQAGTDTVFADISGQMTVNVIVSPNEILGDIWGEILLRGKRVGEAYTVGNAGTVTWYANPVARIPVFPGDVIEIAVKKPFAKSITATISRPTVGPVNSISLIKNLNSLIAAKVISGSTFGRPSVAISAFMTKINANLPPAGRPGNPTNVSKAMALARDYSALRIQLWNNPNLRIYKTTAAAQAAVAAEPVKPGVFIVDYQANELYGFKDEALKVLPGLKLQDIFGSPRVFGSIVDGGGSYRTELNGTLTKLA